MPIVATTRPRPGKREFLRKGCPSEPRETSAGRALSFMSAEFCDTNVFVYAYDSSAGQKNVQAKELVQRLWESGEGIVSIQILQELFVTLTGKLASRLSPEDARGIVSDLATWPV